MESIENIYGLFLQSKGVITDSRQDVNDKLFFALSGENFDGNKFAGKALEKGAFKAIIDNPEYKKNNDYILVDDALKSLQQLALFHRKQFDIPLVAITGTNGKTTTKELVNIVLKSNYNVVATQGNYNNHIGVPLTLLRINKDTQIAVIEMGASNTGEIALLCRIALPTHGLITNIGKAHLEGFGSFEGVKKTKKELYDYLKQKNGTVFVNGDDKILNDFSKGINRRLYGLSGYDVNGKIISHFPYLKVRLNTGTGSFDVSTKMYGSYNLPNILAAATIGKYFNVNDNKIRESLESYVPSNNRSQITKTAKNTIIQDAYNANPVSISKAIESFYSAGFNNPCLILSDMLELGDFSVEEHKKIIDLIRDKGFKCVFLIGKYFGNVNNEFITLKSTEQAEEYLKKNPVKNKTILLKGSRGMHLETLIPYL